MAVLISQSASSVKKPTKNAVQFKAKKKLLVEDNLHEAEVARGELFYLDETKAGCFLYDPDPSGVFYKFKITKKVFKQLSKEHTLVVSEQRPKPKKPTPSKSLIPESPAYKGKITTTAPDVRLLAKKLADFDPSGKFTMQKNGMYSFTSKRAVQLPFDLMEIANACNVTYLGPADVPGKVLFIPNTAKGSFTRINSSLRGGSKVGTFSGDVSILDKLKSVFGAPSNAMTDGKAFNSYTFKTGSYVFSVYQWKVLDNTMFTISASEFDEKALSKFALFLGTNLYRA